MAIAEDIGAARQASRLAAALRARQATRLKNYRESPGTIETAGYGGHPGIVTTNWGGLGANLVNKALAEQEDTALLDADTKAEDARRAALEAVMGAPEGLDARAMVGLTEVGVDPGVFKMLQPEKLGKNQILQYGRDPEGMRAVNAVQPGTFTEEQITGAAAAARAAKEQEFQDNVRLANATRAPREARSPTELDIALNGTPEQKAALAAYLDQKKSRAATGAVRGKVDPVATLQKQKDLAARLRTMLQDPASNEQLFSTKQRVGVPAAVDIPENAGMVERLLAQAAQGEESPMSADLRRMGSEMSFETVKQLYPASNTDIKLAMSMQPKAGDSRASMERYLLKMEEITRKAEAGEYGPPSDGGGEYTARPAYYDRMTPEEQQAWDEDH